MREFQEADKTIETTIVMIKPDGVERGLSETIFTRIADAGFEVAQRRQLTLDEETARVMYADKDDRPDLQARLIEYVTSDTVEVAIISGPGAVMKFRDFMGAVGSEEKQGRGLRQEFALDLFHNTIHSPSSYQEAREQLELLYPDT